MPPFEVRRAEEAGWRELRRIRLRALRDDPDAFGSTYETEAPHREPDWRSWFTGWTRGARQAVFAATDGHGWVGVALGAAFPGEPGVAHLFAMWVEPSWRRRGVGSALTEAVAGWASELGFERVVLGATETNPAAVALYEAWGFVDTGERRPLRDGSALTTIVMERTL